MDTAHSHYYRFPGHHLYRGIRMSFDAEVVLAQDSFGGYFLYRVLKETDQRFYGEQAPPA